MSKKLSKKLKEKWVKALRSGDYLQHQGGLCNKEFDGNTSYCCLGVLKHIVTGKNDFTRGMYYGPNRELALPKGKKDVFEKSIAERLAEMNDTGSSFKKIATWINRNL